MNLSRSKAENKMEKSIYTKQLNKALKLLKRIRQNAGYTQKDLAIRLEKPQSFVSKYESGERRIDIIELITICNAFGVQITEYIHELEKALNEIE